MQTHMVMRKLPSRIAPPVRIFLAACTGLVLLAGVVSAIEPNPVAAAVNGKPVPRESVEKIVETVAASSRNEPDAGELARLYRAALDSLIDLELLYEAAEAEKVAVSTADIEAEVQRTRKHFGNEAEFKKALEQSGMTEERFRAETRKTLLVDRLLAQIVWKNIRIDPTSVEQTYRASSGLGEKAPPPSLEDRHNIEQALQEEERDKRRAEYIGGLRKKATIQILK